MRVQLLFVPPGGGKLEFQRDAVVSSIPRVGDYIMIKNLLDGTATFRVLHVTYVLDAAGGDVFDQQSIEVQVEQVRCPWRTEGQWKERMERYERHPHYKNLISEYPDSGQ